MSPSGRSAALLLASGNGEEFFIADVGKSALGCFDSRHSQVTKWVSLPTPPSGLALSSGGARLFLTCAGAVGSVVEVDVAAWKLVAKIPCGSGAMAPVLSPSGQTLYVCHRFDEEVGVISLPEQAEVGRLRAGREPVAADLAPDGRSLFVASHLPADRAEASYAAASVRVLDVVADTLVREVRLPNGSGGVKDLRISPDGRYAVLTHLVASFDRAASTVREGWMNANGLSVIDVARMELAGTVLLDRPGAGAANPWGLAWTADSRTLVVTVAGTHEVSVIDFPRLLAALGDGTHRSPASAGVLQ